MIVYTTLYIRTSTIDVNYVLKVKTRKPELFQTDRVTRI